MGNNAHELFLNCGLYIQEHLTISRGTKGLVEYHQTSIGSRNFYLGNNSLMKELTWGTIPLWSCMELILTLDIRVGNNSLMEFFGIDTCKLDIWLGTIPLSSYLQLILTHWINDVCTLCIFLMQFFLQRFVETCFTYQYDESRFQNFIDGRPLR